MANIKVSSEFLNYSAFKHIESLPDGTAYMLFYLKLWSISAKGYLRDNPETGWEWSHQDISDKLNVPARFVADALNAFYSAGLMDDYEVRLKSIPGVVEYE